MVTLVVTRGSHSMDLYSQRLSQYLDAPSIHTDIYQKAAGWFNIPLFSLEALRIIKQDYRFIKMLRNQKGVLHLPNHDLARYANFLKIPFIVTVHDLIRFFDLKGMDTFIHKTNLRDRIYLSLDYRGIRKARRVIAVSENTKKDLIEFLKIPQERIRVIYHGVDQQIYKPSKIQHFDNPYILFVGSEHPRKNLATLLKAFSNLRGDERSKDLKLIKVGKAGGREANFREKTLEVVDSLELRQDVIFTDFVAEEELVSYYSNAECLVFPSLQEGFGWPPLEAMACGCPVIASNASSCPEVVGDAAIMVDPKDVGGMENAMKEIIDNKSLRDEMIERGLERAKEFSWHRAAQEVMEVYREVEQEL